MIVSPAASRLHRAVLFVAGCALCGSAVLMAAHLASHTHCDPGDPDHECDICRRVDGNPPVTVDPPIVAAVAVTAFVDETPAVPLRSLEFHLPPGRAPPVKVHVT